MEKLLLVRTFFIGLATIISLLFKKIMRTAYYYLIVYVRDWGYLDRLYSAMEYGQKRRDMRVIARRLNIPTTHLDEQTIRDRIHDRLYPLEKENHEESAHFKHICHDYRTKKPGPTWVVFLPWRTTLKEAKTHNLLPTTGRVIAYEGPIGLVNPDPAHVKDFLLKLVKDLKKKKLKQFNLLGLSVGNYVAFYVASMFDNVEKFVSVVPGYDLGACMYGSNSASLVAEMAKELGYEDHHAYDKELKGFNPGKHFRNLPKDIEVHVAEKDQSIESSQALRLIDELKDMGLNIHATIYPGKGHVLTIAHFGQTHPY
jgi:hypothetical protein